MKDNVGKVNKVEQKNREDLKVGIEGILWGSVFVIKSLIKGSLKHLKRGLVAIRDKRLNDRVQEKLVFKDLDDWIGVVGAKFEEVGEASKVKKTLPKKIAVKNMTRTQQIKINKTA